LRNSFEFNNNGIKMCMQIKSDMNGTNTHVFTRSRSYPLDERSNWKQKSKTFHVLLYLRFYIYLSYQVSC